MQRISPFIIWDLRIHWCRDEGREDVNDERKIAWSKPRRADANSLGDVAHRPKYVREGECEALKLRRFSEAAAIFSV
jgi:hypothetical protein